MQAAPGSALQPAVPRLAGVTLLASGPTPGGAFALFSLNREGLELLEVSGANALTGGAYSLRLFAAGDVNGDGNVDGVDAQLLTAALGRSAGQPGYVVSADANLDGKVDATDMGLLAANLGFAANRPPVTTAGQVTTHKDLAATVDLSTLATDPEDDPIYYRVVGAQHGTATLGVDGHTVTFLPAADYTGPAAFQFQADDGYGTSATATVSVTVSTAALVSLDFTQRNPRVNPGEVRQVSLVGDFADQKGVPLPASYAIFQSTDPSVFTAAASGQITAVANGAAVLLASSHGIQAATAVAVGSPSALVQQVLYGEGLTTSLKAETLPAHVGAHQLAVSLADQIDLTPAGTGTRYFSSNPQIVQVSADGLVTTGDRGAAAVTVINGPAEEVVPVVVSEPAAGPVTVGAGGAVVAGADGSLVMVAPGAVTSDTTMSIARVSQSSLPMAPPSIVQFVGAFQLDFGGQKLARPAQLVVPVAPGTPVGATVYFYRAGSLPDAAGDPQPTWLETEIGRVEADGFAHTTSYDGLTEAGLYAAGIGGLGNLFIAPVVTGATDPTTFFAASAQGGNVSVLLLKTGGVIDLPPGSQELTLKAIPKAGTPVLTPITVTVAHGAGTRITPVINTPSFSLAKPQIDSLTLDLATPQQPRLTITGKNFGSSSDKVQVRFQVGGRDPTDARGGPAQQVGGGDVLVPAQVLSDTQVQVDLTAAPANTVAVGAAALSVVRDVSNQHTFILESNAARFPLTSGHAFAAQRATSQLAVLDTRPSSPNFNKVAEIPLTENSSPQYVAATPDNTRAYVTTKLGIAVVDTLALRQIQVGGLVGGNGLISLTAFNPRPDPFQIVIEHEGKYAYVTDHTSTTVYILDVDPNSDSYNTCVGTVMNLRAGSFGLRGLDVTSDDKRLFVAQPNVPDFSSALAATTTRAATPQGYILDVDIDPSSRTRWQQVGSPLKADQDPYGVRATSRADVVLFTNFLSDATGLGVIRGANGAHPNVEQFSLDLPNPDPGGPFAVHNAIDVAVTPDGSEAFVAGFNTLNANDPSKHHGEPVNNPAGSNVGVVKFQIQQAGTAGRAISTVQDAHVVAATRSLPSAYPQSVAVTPDGQEVYVSYPTLGAGAIFVYNVPAINAALAQDDAALLSRFGIDDIALHGDHLNPATGQRFYNVAIDVQGAYAQTGEQFGSPVFSVYDPAHAPLNIGGLPRGLAMQGFPLVVSDASGDDSPQTVFQHGALRVSYDFSAAQGAVRNVTLQYLHNGAWEDWMSPALAPFSAFSQSGLLINLQTTTPAAGPVLLRAKAALADGTFLYSNLQNLTVLSGRTTVGNYKFDIFLYGAADGKAAVFDGQGGTDSISLGLPARAVASLDGVPLSQFRTVAASPPGQAIYHGSAYDYLRLTDGREIYFQGVERLLFADGSPLDLQVQASDDRFSGQWNLFVTDVPDAWRFTTGSPDVLLVSLDSGFPSDTHQLDDLSAGRLVTGPQTVMPTLLRLDVPEVNQHGHEAISIMASTPQNGGVAGINWVSPVVVENVFNPPPGTPGGLPTLLNGILDGLSRAAAGQHVVFQAGLQGEGWLQDPSHVFTPADLQTVITSNQNRALFAVAAGNGGLDINDPTPPTHSPTNLYRDGRGNLFTGSVARLQTSALNVLAVGALQYTTYDLVTTLAGASYKNAAGVKLAPYSNSGPSLTLVAPTDSPAAASSNDVQTITLTSGQTGGTFTLRFAGSSTADIPQDADAATVRAALEVLPGIGRGNIAVGGDSGGPWQVMFVNALKDTSEPLMTGLASGPATVTVTDNFDRFPAFTGTSAANPNLAGIASLVWSIDPTLTGVQVRQLLVDTAMDLGTPDRDNNFGYGLVDAGAAVRRAYALVQSPDLAGLYTDNGQIVAAGGLLPGPRIPAHENGGNLNKNELDSAHDASVGQPEFLAGMPKPASADTPALTTAQLQLAVTEATSQLEAAGLPVSPLSGVTFHIADLPGSLLGWTSEKTVWIDPNAQGYGWYVDVSPASSGAFIPVVPGKEQQAPATSPAYGHVDLLTVVTHELGHVLGFASVSPSILAHDWMTATLAPGVRRYPDAEAPRQDRPDPSPGQAMSSPALVAVAPTPARNQAPAAVDRVFSEPQPLSQEPTRTAQQPPQAPTLALRAPDTQAAQTDGHQDSPLQTCSVSDSANRAAADSVFTSWMNPLLNAVIAGPPVQVGAFHLPGPTGLAAASGDVLLGGSGEEVLVGDSGRNLLVGGFVESGAMTGDRLLVVLDAASGVSDLTAIDAVFAEWAS